MASAATETAPQLTAIEHTIKDHETPATTAPMEMTDLSPTIETPRQSEAFRPTETSAPQGDRPIDSPDAATEGPGPATEKPTEQPSPTIGPAQSNSKSVLGLTLLLTSGARHPYKIDEKYLKSRKVTAVDAEGAFDPRELSGYKLKELIWTDWRSEWEPRPASPSAIRLISMGRLLEDKSMLKELPLKMDDMNIMHMSIKPADFLDDDEAHGGTGKGGHSLRARDGGDGGSGCRCVIL